MPEGTAAPFTLDSFQRRAIEALDQDRSVLVCAPTGAGKTVVAEHAIEQALRDGKRAFYTTPIKALSNQKHRDLVAVYGEDRIGIVTGDVSIGSDAPVVVMTTEVLRNMLYGDRSALTHLGCVILDEVHYLEDRERGAVWEEVLIHTDPGVRFVCLSATVSNADELGAWLTSVRGPTDVIVEHRRPVELRNRFVVATRGTGGLQEIPVLVDGRPNPAGQDFEVRSGRASRGRDVPRKRWAVPRREAIATLLASSDRLPAIVFVFSRARCDEAARSLAETGLSLTTPDDQSRIRQIVDQVCVGIGERDREVLEVDRFTRQLAAGIAAHHAGMVPAMKTAVEECFTRGLVKIVYATETLALGLNMPARTVVIEQLTRFRGEGHEMLTPGEYTQLTGRAGRRGIDPVGDALVLWSPYVSFAEVAELAGSREFRLRSAFRPTYNMVANLVAVHSPEEARDLLSRSFAQFQLAGQVEESRREIRGYKRTLKSLRGARASRRDHQAIAATQERLDAAIRGLEADQDTLADQFGRLLQVLEACGVLDGWSLTGRGRQLTRITHESDLLVVLAVDGGVFDGVAAEELAGIASALVYEHRSRDPAPPPMFATAVMADRVDLLEQIASRLRGHERRNDVGETRIPDPTLVAAVHGWASGHDLDEMLPEDLGSPGDFVRNVRRLIDLCGQISSVASDRATRREAVRATELLRRGIVATVDTEVGAIDVEPDGSR